MAQPSPSQVGERALLIEFSDGRTATAAARVLRETGHAILDAFTPRPVEALELLVAPERSTLGPTIFAFGVVGAAFGLGVQWACNAWDFPLNVGGRPPFALPVFVPIAFESLVLFASFAAFLGFFGRAGLPKLAHPVFEVDGFERATIDRYWLLIGPAPGADADELRSRLAALGPLRVVSWPRAAAARGGE